MWLMIVKYPQKEQWSVTIAIFVLFRCLVLVSCFWVVLFFFLSCVVLSTVGNYYLQDQMLNQGQTLKIYNIFFIRRTNITTVTVCGGLCYGVGCYKMRQQKMLQEVLQPVIGNVILSLHHPKTCRSLQSVTGTGPLVQCVHY